MAAEIIATAGYTVHIFDSKPTVARKFLLAGVGGMNITHAEDWPLFIQRYSSSHLLPILEQLTPTDLRNWIHTLGINTFVGSSGRVFPTDMKAAPLLRAWLHRLRTLPVQFFMRHRCLGWNENHQLCLESPEGIKTLTYSTVVLALGGGSWPQLGSDGHWQHWLAAKGIHIDTLKPANCGFEVRWSDYLKTHCAGNPLKNIDFSFIDHHDQHWHKRGECLITDYGLEGSAIYALSAPLRDSIDAGKQTTLWLDLLPDTSLEKLELHFDHAKTGITLSRILRDKCKLSPAAIALVHEAGEKDWRNNAHKLAAMIKKLPIELHATRPLEEAISSAGGICFSELNEKLMLKKLPGVFCAGEMLDWEAPTGGYLLTACFATGVVAGKGVVEWLSSQHAP